MDDGPQDYFCVETDAYAAQTADWFVPNGLDFYDLSRREDGIQPRLKRWCLHTNLVAF